MYQTHIFSRPPRKEKKLILRGCTPGCRGGAYLRLTSMTVLDVSPLHQMSSSSPDDALAILMSMKDIDERRDFVAEDVEGGGSLNQSAGCPWRWSWRFPSGWTANGAGLAGSSSRRR